MKAIGKGSLASFLMVLLNVGWYGVACVLAAVLVMGVLGLDIAVQMGPEGSPSLEGPGVKMAIPVSFTVDADMHRVTAPSLGIGEAQIQNARGTLGFRPRKGAFRVANLAIVIAMLALAMWVLGQLRGVFRTLRDGQPFVPANTTRIRRIAWAVIFGEIAASGGRIIRELLRHDPFPGKRPALLCPLGIQRLCDHQWLDHPRDRRSLPGGDPPG